MKRLILMRHAKSDWSHPGQADHDRPLNQRGRLAAPLMAAWLRDKGLVPDIAYVSSALRTQETWGRMGLAAEMEVRPTLYHATPEATLEAARAADEMAGTVLLLGHMPSIRDAANLMIGAHEVADFPTAKIAVIGFESPSWFEIAFGDGRLQAEAAPKDLV